MNNDSSVNDIDLMQNINDFTSLMEERGFIVQEGEFRYLNILKLCSLGLVDTCMGNNATSAYALFASTSA